MKLLLSMFIVLLLVLPQEFVEASDSTTLDSLSTIKEGDVGEVAALHKMYLRPKINCEFACARRCRESSRVKVCARACGSCCERCQCVPPGTYGNKAACPCYATLRTHGRKPKCP
ncbi:hypothetical protein Sjap_021446 [Stephania japonica]|uniref:Snakin-2 n=1 Tax=Stephania japonica TaxID=461633 RepID=A0AAP0EVU3_9MAGN